MSFEVSQRELDSIVSLPAEERYQYFITRVADWGETWSLFGADGWILASGPKEQQLIPLWPAKAFASACATDLWQDSQPKQIPLEEFLEKWVPGMIQDDREIALFPTIDNRGIVVSPRSLEFDLRAEATKYE